MKLFADVKWDFFGTFNPVVLVLNVVGMSSQNNLSIAFFLF